MNTKRVGTLILALTFRWNGHQLTMDIGSQIQDGIGEEDENSELENIGAVDGATPKRRTKCTEKGKSYNA